MDVEEGGECYPPRFYLDCVIPIHPSSLTVGLAAEICADQTDVSRVGREYDDITNWATRLRIGRCSDLERRGRCGFSGGFSGLQGVGLCANGDCFSSGCVVLNLASVYGGTGFLDRRGRCLGCTTFNNPVVRGCRFAYFSRLRLAVRRLFRSGNRTLSRNGQ